MDTGNKLSLHDGTSFSDSLIFGKYFVFLALPILSLSFRIGSV